MTLYPHHIAAIERAMLRLDAELAKYEPGDYDAMFPAADLQSLGEVILYLRQEGQGK